ncbi:murein biosynthesis integral membrane protein MurJ, partial [Streptomyces sp. SID685]|nr:murein biosynthesis integral membrane protein MurJ [Streptomyces sp. SID685]
LRSSAVHSLLRLLAAAVPACALGHVAARFAAPAGALAAAAAGIAAIVLMFTLLARPLRLEALLTLLARARRRAARR